MSSWGLACLFGESPESSNKRSQPNYLKFCTFAWASTSARRRSAVKASSSKRLALLVVQWSLSGKTWQFCTASTSLEIRSRWARNSASIDLGNFSPVHVWNVIYRVGKFAQDHTSSASWLLPRLQSERGIHFKAWRHALAFKCLGLQVVNQVAWQCTPKSDLPNLCRIF